MLGWGSQHAAIATSRGQVIRLFWLRVTQKAAGSKVKKSLVRLAPSSVIYEISTTGVIHFFRGTAGSKAWR
jgi:hypothetical protein